MKKLIKKIKSNKGFTMQDVIVAMAIMVLFAGTIGGIYIAVYKIQSETKLNAVATLYGVQIMENIDKIDYDEVNSSHIATWKSTYGIPDSMNLSLEVKPYDSDDLVKTVKLTISYEFSGKTETIVLEKLKVKEV